MWNEKKPWNWLLLNCFSNSMLILFYHCIFLWSDIAIIADILLATFWTISVQHAGSLISSSSSRRSNNSQKILLVFSCWSVRWFVLSLTGITMFLRWVVICSLGIRCRYSFELLLPYIGICKQVNWKIYAIINGPNVIGNPSYAMYIKVASVTPYYR
jgi:hypothetical protein